MPVYIASTDCLICAKVAVIQILYICTPEWKSLLCLLRQWGFIDLLQSWQITFSLVWWIFLLCLHKVPSVAAWKSHFAHEVFWWKWIEFVCCCKRPFVVNEYSQKLQLNLILSWSDFLWLKTLLLLLSSCYMYCTETETPLLHHYNYDLSTLGEKVANLG